MLRVPARRQRDATSCLPACVEAVLSFLGQSVEWNDVRQWCGTSALGSVPDLAVQGLAQAGIDAELLQAESLEELAELVAEGRPPIAIVAQGGEWAHAVVVCEVGSEAVIVMDPRRGTYVSIEREQFLLDWLQLAGETLLVGGAQRCSRRSTI